MSEKFLNFFANNIVQDKNLRGNSSKWANWMSNLTLFTCQYCTEQHGTIVDISVLKNKTEVKEHPNCKCIYVPMRTKAAGTATTMGFRGADAQIFYLNKLPDYYVDKRTAYIAGWKKKNKQLGDVLPGKMIGGDVYDNDDFKLPSATGRIWYEADINYSGGKRNRQRILYSNDGLLFATYDHYQTFYEITK